MVRGPYAVGVTLTRVFVYGSLLPGGWNEGVARAGGAYSAEPAWLDGVRLVHFEPEAYPGVFVGGGRVHGVVYGYAPTDWPRAVALLDELEGLNLTPPLYDRRMVEVQTAGGPLSAWTYFYARPGRLAQPGCVEVPSGRWLERPGA